MLLQNINQKIRLCFSLLLLASLALQAQQTPPPNQSTVSVTGAGTVSVQPDVILFDITLTHTASKTKQAQEVVNKAVNQALAIFKEAKIEDKNIKTTALRFQPEYDYRNSKRMLIGQRAEQAIRFSIENIATDSKRASDILDKLTAINGIELDRMEFDVKNKTEYYIKARNLAYQKALDKANQFAQLAGLKVVKPLRIEEDPGIIPFSFRNSQVMKETAMDMASGSTALPSGELEITTEITVVFIME